MACRRKHKQHGVFFGERRGAPSGPAQVIELAEGFSRSYPGDGDIILAYKADDADTPPFENEKLFRRRVLGENSIALFIVLEFAVLSQAVKLVFTET